MPSCLAAQVEVFSMSPMLRVRPIHLSITIECSHAWLCYGDARVQCPDATALPNASTDSPRRILHEHGLPEGCWWAWNDTVLIGST